VTHYDFSVTVTTSKEYLINCHVLLQFFEVVSLQVQLVKLSCKLIIIWVDYKRKKKGFLWNTVYNVRDHALTTGFRCTPYRCDPVGWWPAHIRRPVITSHAEVSTTSAPSTVSRLARATSGSVENCPATLVTCRAVGLWMIIRSSPVQETWLGASTVFLDFFFIFVFLFLCKRKRWYIAFNGKPIVKLRSVTCHMASRNVRSQPTRVNAPRLTSAKQVGTRSARPARMEGQVDFGVGYGLPVRRQSSLDSHLTVSRTLGLLIASPAPFRYTTKPQCLATWLFACLLTYTPFKLARRAGNMLTGRASSMFARRLLDVC